MANTYNIWIVLLVLLSLSLFFVAAWFLFREVSWRGMKRNKFIKWLLSRGNKKLRHFATHDPLTDLPNRVLLMDRIQHAIHVARRSGNTFALLFMDLDDFKVINDTCGHAAGDSLLVAVGRRIQNCIRSEDMVSRVGGDEFVVIMGNLASTEAISNSAENILMALRQEFDIEGAVLRISASVGIAVYPNSGETAEVLMKNADAATYEAKQNGRNTYRFFEPAMHASAMRHLHIRQALRSAIEKNQFQLHFQPKFNCETQAITGLEALLRWHHPVLGNMGPGEFVPIAERSGQIIAIGAWVLREVCASIAQWDALGMPPVRVAMNLSPLQLRRDLAKLINEMVGGMGIPSRRIVFEISEAAAMKNVERSSRTIAELQTFGFDVAIDGFGSGYSNVAHLHAFHCQHIKIDRTFIARLGHGSGAEKIIVSAMIAMAHALGMEVVAEGVETTTQLEILKELKCDQMQGFLLGRPMKASDIEFLLGFSRAPSSE
ncbi:EAL domain-containing protein [Herbaspirillum sp. RTI4]|uniref:putative bifunctional diguanylate cyclase/phosphodiesterase n=1 Tax=Herbaspirillum sp. RTI4 TaxID=3048640 RepID=UPI002AB5B102|nr:EAL domain-containing protein [Herbaspirillum sp. RTI4]MDY7580052.1 EAL domain-containing protein [Herbaspirillum sp. RTI4]MEA9982965.1 EAL domain-containing protein [Herbaspirillum sp. RTI4]